MKRKVLSGLLSLTSISLIVTFILSTLVTPLNAQLVRTKNLNLNFDRNKTIIFLKSDFAGDLYWGDKFYAQIFENDSLYIVNVDEGVHSFKLISSSGQEYDFMIRCLKSGQVVGYHISSDGVTKEHTLKYEEIAKNASGMTVFHIPAPVLYIEISPLISFSPGISGLIGYRIVPEFAAGIGISKQHMGLLEILVNSHASTVLMPVYVHMDICTGNKRAVSPIFYTDFGISFTDSEYIKGGLYYAFGLGARSGIGRHFYYSGSLDLRTQEYTRLKDYWGQSDKKKSFSATYFGFKLGLGYQF